CQQGYYYPFTF
nr:immunoglobulin light chain junction region [Macaca mulatta]MOW73376.1 immunoglobulin light chain junction region [Macaca mulatta]MOW73477.1 immunoglobulin light chain junction region [Macaca mulatta]MOW73530.1 immunoglobulin light chain junction region [Macaca mulatta]MOW74243.1 immunoglobulin light chain junction region [Macaca mulatta]